MFASSAFVLAALTMTGVYMKSRNMESKDDGYTIDFTALEDSTDEKYREIAQNTGSDTASAPENLEDDLDYMPMEAGSSLVEIPGLTDGMASEAELSQEELLSEELLSEEEQPGEENEKKTDQKTTTQSVVVTKELSFSEEVGLLRPVNGETVIPYSMDASTYFATLDQYKYNPAVMIGAEEGTAVSACAEGKVVSIFENEEIGHAITMDLGDGYEITYGQLKEICVTVNSYVNPGEKIATVAAPTKYYSVEGSNLYLQLTRDGVPLNPESLF